MTISKDEPQLPIPPGLYKLTNTISVSEAISLQQSLEKGLAQGTVTKLATDLTIEELIAAVELEPTFPAYSLEATNCLKKACALLSWAQDCVSNSPGWDKCNDEISKFLDLNK